MRFLIALVCCIVLIGILAKPLKRHPAPFYIVALALVGLYWFGTTTNTAGGLWPYFMPLMQRCALAFVLFTIVMFVGVLGSCPSAASFPSLAVSSRWDIWRFTGCRTCRG